MVLVVVAALFVWSKAGQTMERFECQKATWAPYGIVPNGDGGWGTIVNHAVIGHYNTPEELHALLYPAVHPCVAKASTLAEADVLEAQAGRAWNHAAELAKADRNDRYQINAERVLAAIEPEKVVSFRPFVAEIWRTHRIDVRIVSAVLRKAVDSGILETDGENYWRK